MLDLPLSKSFDVSLSFDKIIIEMHVVETYVVLVFLVVQNLNHLVLTQEKYKMHS